MPRPLKTEWYWPAMRSSTRRMVRTSMWRIFLRNSRGIICSRHGHRIQEMLHDLLAGHFIRFGLERPDDAVPQHIHRDGLHVLRGDITTPAEKGVRFASQGQIDSRTRRSSEANFANHRGS